MQGIQTLADSPAADIDEVRGHASPEARGLGGWLLLPAIALVISPFRLFHDCLTGLLPVFKPDVWNALTSADSPAYQAQFASLVMAELVATLLLIGLIAWTGWSFVRRTRHTPRLVIAVLVAFVALQLLHRVLVSLLPAEWAPVGALDAEVFQAAGLALVGIPCFLASRRVRETFVR